MKKFLFILFGLFVVAGAFGAGENVPTSKSYVDNAMTTKQDKISANDGATQVLTNTGTAGEYDTKGIYDATGSYATQTTNLVDAVTMNTAVQNAINAEFVCISWVDDDPTKDCLLMEIRGKTERRSPNLFDVSKLINTSRITNNGDGSITITTPAGDSAATTGRTLAQLAPGLEVGKQYTFTFKYSIIVDNPTYPPSLFLRYAPDITKSTYIRRSGVVITITQVMLDSVFYFSYETNSTCNVYDIQITEGTVATPYQPYGNIYVPSEN